MLYLIWEIGEVAQSSGQIGDWQLFKLHETTNQPDQSNELSADTGADFNQPPSPRDTSRSSGMDGHYPIVAFRLLVQQQGVSGNTSLHTVR